MVNDGRYELRGAALYLDGKPLPIDPAVVRVVLERWGTKLGRASTEKIAPESVRLILKLQSVIAVARLEADLRKTA